MTDKVNDLVYCFLLVQVTIYQCEAKGVVKLLQAYADADVSFY